MGLSIKCKKTGTKYYFGYVGMFQLRSKIAELFDKKLGKLYVDIYKAPKAKIKEALSTISSYSAKLELSLMKIKEALSTISLYANQHKPVTLKVWNFLFLPDTGAEISYDCCKEIYDGINGKCDDWIIGYAGQEISFTWNQFVDLLKECYDNKSDLIWE